jgi:guanine deaminase
LVLPIITPRFAVSCSSDALSLLGALAASTSPPTHIQTHISENRDEIDLVLSLHKACESYAQVYDKASLLTPLTILAHGVHLTSEERQLIRDRGASISHCPASNTAIGSGLCPVRTLLDDGVNVGLGTDVSGGYSSSILEAARQACLVSRMVGCQKSNNRPTRNSRESLSVEEALYLATRGGAKSLGMQEELGGFEKGMFWDAQMISLGGNVGTDERGEADNVVNGEDRCLEHDSDSTAGPVDVFGWETWEEKVAKWVWTGDDRNVKAVWVAGRLVHSRK